MHVSNVLFMQLPFLYSVTIAVLLSLHAVNSYVLLTANLDDMHSLAKEIAESPLANQINTIIRRAAALFKEPGQRGRNEPSRKAQMRSDPHLDEEQNPVVTSEQTAEKNQTDLKEGQELARKSDNNLEIWKPDQKVLAAELNKNVSDSSSEISGESNGEKSSRREDAGSGFAELGRNASFYLNSIKKIFESV